MFQGCCSRFAALVGLLVVFVAVWPKLFGAPAAPPVWHEGERWAEFLRVNNALAGRLYSPANGCRPQLIRTSFGDVHTYACGDRSRPAVLFLPGAGSNSVIYGDWVLPRVAERHFAVAVDFVCDVGQSVPRDKNPANCPQSETELAQWVYELVAGLGITEPVALVGTSYGAFVAAVTADQRPELVERLVLVAPAAVIAPLELGWLLRALAYGLLWHGNWFFGYMSAKPDFVYERDIGSAEHQALLQSIARLSTTKLAVNVRQFSDERLGKLAGKTLVLLGERETVTSAAAAVAAGARTGVTVEVLAGAGHLLVIESPAREIA